MTPEEKSKELANKFLKTGMMINQAKQCALICVNELLELSTTQKEINYWNEVKQEIELL